jgi:hypothetical protein
MAGGCGRLKPPGAAADADVTGAAGSGAAPTDAAGGAAPDAPPDQDSGAATFQGRPLPADVSAPARIFDERAVLLGNVKTACTNQTPPSGDGHRWCAFTYGGAGGIGDLWVIDVTRAAAGDVPPCDGTSAGCLRLTTTLALQSATEFDGDTLIYHSDPVSAPGEDFLGPISAWRPGWTAGRQISSGRGFTCIGSTGAAVAACFDDPVGDPVNRDGADVRMGGLADGAAGPLPSLGPWPLRNGNETAWQAGFSPDGASFVLSSAPTIGATEELRVWPVGAEGPSPAPVLDDVAYWKISNDGQKLYFWRGLPPTASLFVADFPSGANVQLLETDTVAFALLGTGPADQALAIERTHGDVGVTFELLADRSTTTAKPIFTYDDILDGVYVSADLSHTVWLDVSFLAKVVRNTDLVTCAVNDASDPPIHEPAFLDTAGLLFWKELLPSDNSRHDGYFARPDQCHGRTRFARDLDFVTPLGDTGVLFGDELDLPSSRSTLKYVATSGGATALDPRGPVRIQAGVRTPVVLVGASTPLVVYEAAGPTPETSGWFVFGPVPLPP